MKKNKINLANLKNQSLHKWAGAKKTIKNSNLIFVI